jgi:8-oxo-dGTP diphosphatase
MADPFPKDRLINGALCYVIRDNQLLMLRRNRPPHQGLWTAPGGKLELGESPDEGVIREIQEETRLTIHAPTLRGIVTVNDVHYSAHWLLFIFRADDPQGDVLLGETQEGLLAWLPLNHLAEYPLPRADQLYLPRVLAGANHVFRAKFVYDTPNTCLEETFYI